jgi:ABC-2 type transport system ATP-binding protein
MLALSVENLSKTYPGGKQALKGINLAITEGEFMALLGPNGAGKTTAINIITSLCHKSSGEVKIFGFDHLRESLKAKQFIGIVPQEFNFNIFEKVQDIVITQGGFFGLSLRVAKQRTEKYLKKLELWDKRNTIARTLSGGMKRRLMIARALVHEPKILILDEPTAGVDIEIRRSMWDFLQEINANGTTIVLTTHYLEEAEQLCNRIAIIDQGEIVRDQDKQSILQEMQLQSFIIDAEGQDGSLTESKEYDIKVVDDNTLQFSLAKEQSLNDVFAFLSSHGITVKSIRPQTNRLEEVFLSSIRKG